jgi:hypothetical protein
VIASARKAEDVTRLTAEGSETVQLDLADSASIQKARFFHKCRQITLDSQVQCIGSTHPVFNAGGNIAPDPGKIVCSLHRSPAR